MVNFPIEEILVNVIVRFHFLIEMKFWGTHVDLPLTVNSKELNIGKG